MQVVGVDGGNKNVKVVSASTAFLFPSDLGEYRQRKLEATFSKDDMIIEFRGRKMFAGTLAQYESEFAGAMMGDTKAHEETLIRVLIALHRVSDETDFKIVVGQPIKKHTKEEKEKIAEMLVGEHEFTLNGKTKQIKIHQCSVGAEGASAYWSAPIYRGIVHIIDPGGGTVNCATLDSGRYIDKSSFTLDFGHETVINKDLSEFARAIVRGTSKKWNKSAKVLLVGGEADNLIGHLREHYALAEVLKPRLQAGDNVKVLPAIFANAVAFYTIGAKLYE